MKHWLGKALEPLAAVSSGHAVVLDPDGLLDDGELPGEVATATNSWDLRRSYELRGRRRALADPPLFLHVRGAVASELLPWDIERRAATVVTVRLPGPPAIRAVVAALEPAEADVAIAAVANAADPTAALVSCLTGIRVGSTPLPRHDQLRLAARVASRTDWPAKIATMARRWVLDPVLVPMLDQPPDARALQVRWQAFASGESGDWGSIFDLARLEIGQLFTSGILNPVVASAALPAWASFGERHLDEEERARQLLASRPEPYPPQSAGGWGQLAQWWGAIRSLVASASAELRQTAWTTWSEVNDEFLLWVRANYGLVLSSASLWPSAVHRIAPFLARRLREQQPERILLVVLDGLGYAQWHFIVERAGLTVAEAAPVFALVPSYTTVSRQAIFAGQLPTSFPDSLWATSAEPARWKAFWAAEGVTAVSYARLKGRLPLDRIDIGVERITGLVVNAVDDLMHSSELFGDAQLLANLAVWLDNGFLADLLDRAEAAGAEVWLTADHGNLECQGSGLPSEGAVPEAAGKRLLRYPNRVLRDDSHTEGIDWDDIPGLPPDTYLRFAPGRSAYTNLAVSVSHGALSLDELVVPLARVTR